MARVLFAEFDRNYWRRIFITGINQDGKSLIGFIIPTLYDLFEKKETAIMGVPSLNLVRDKWQGDLLPAIKASRYKDLLPLGGGGSRGGDPMLVRFRHGPLLRFMTAGGDDQSRSAFTAKHLHVTETEGFDEVGANSREGDKFRQLERRLLAFGEQARTVAECTVGLEKGLTWREYTNGTWSRIAIPCPHCGNYVTPEREHLVGWQDAENELDAISKTSICCPACAALWTNEQRIEANHQMVLVHRGQDVDRNGRVTGPLPQTNTLGFRWTVVNSILNPRRIFLVGGKEWTAKRDTDEDKAEKDLRQSEWALPVIPDKADISKLDALAIVARIKRDCGRGEIPEDTVLITVGVDCGLWQSHWTAIAWGPGATPHVIEYGLIENPAKEMAEEQAVLIGLRQWRDTVLAEGWGGRKASLAFIDAGEWQDIVIGFCAESEGFMPTKGHGVGQQRGKSRVRETGTKVVARFDHYNELELENGSTLIEIDVDHWKSWFQARLRTPIGKPGAMTLYRSDERGGVPHHTWAKHATAEKQEDEFVQDVGWVRKWKTVSRNNHYGDSAMLACVAGNAIGMRLIDDEAESDAGSGDPQQQPEQSNFVTSYRGRY